MGGNLMPLLLVGPVASRHLIPIFYGLEAVLTH
jgi:hypothetical protein